MRKRRMRVVGEWFAAVLLWLACVLVAAFPVRTLLSEWSEPCPVPFLCGFLATLAILVTGGLLAGAVILTRLAIRGSQTPDLDDRSAIELDKLDRLLRAGALTKDEHAQAVDKLLHR